MLERFALFRADVEVLFQLSWITSQVLVFTAVYFVLQSTVETGHLQECRPRSPLPSGFAGEEKAFDCVSRPKLEDPHLDISVTQRIQRRDYP